MTTYLEYIKNYGNLDQVIMLLKERKVTDVQIMEILEIPKQSIYNARKRQQPLLKYLVAPTILPQKYGDPDVNNIVDTFKDKFGTTLATTRDRQAAHRLAQKHGAENIVNVIVALAHFKSEKFAPVINSVSQLDAKLPGVISFLKKQEDNSSVIGSL